MNENLKPDSLEWWREVAQGLGVHIHVQREALHAALRDIGEWQQLARRQFAELPHASHNPLAPTEAGLAASDRVCKQITDALAFRAGEGRPSTP